MIIINLIYIVMLIFGILQIILFFKIWKMTNDITKLKDEYSGNSKNMLDTVNKLVSLIKEMNNKNKEHNHTPINPIHKKKEPEILQPIQPKKELPAIDKNSNDYKRMLRKLNILKDKGFIEQAIKEYMDYTQRDYASALEFINKLQKEI